MNFFSGSTSLKNIIGAAAFTCAVFAGIGYAFSEEAPTPKCIAHLTDISSVAGVTVEDLSDAETASIIEKKGAAPAEGVFATVTLDDKGVFIIHHGDCVTFSSGRPVPLELLKKFLGRTDA